jgi:hypothetical protein
MAQTPGVGSGSPSRSPDTSRRRDACGFQCTYDRSTRSWSRSNLVVTGAAAGCQSLTE